jgi:ATP-dependent exoDNAse (exonuclease V) beta subunit
VVNTELNNFQTFINEKYPASNLLYEVPVNGKNEDGALVSGIVDLLIEEDAGYWIIDHKTDQLDVTDESITAHLPQLMAYATIIDGYREKPVLGVGINWVRSGQLSIVTMGNTRKHGA